MSPILAVQSSVRLRRLGLWGLALGGFACGATVIGVGLHGASRTRPVPTPVALPDPSPPKITSAIRQAVAAVEANEQTIEQAKSLIRACRARFALVSDYACTFSKRERMPCGETTDWQVLTMKSRVAPESFYFKYQRPKAGREAIYVSGQNQGKALVHDVGLGRLLAGTLHLDPNGSMAMEDCRHPITEAGLGHMIETVVERWDAELQAGESLVSIEPDVQVAGRPCTRIESKHPQKLPGFLFHVVRITIDHELGLPTRFEAFDWPKQPGAHPEAVEEYAFDEVKLNIGLTARDFDPKNRSYSFGRF